MCIRDRSYTVSKAEIEASKEMFEKEKQYLLNEIITLKEKLGKCNNTIQGLEKNAKEYEKQMKELKSNLEVSLQISNQCINTIRFFEIILLVIDLNKFESFHFVGFVYFSYFRLRLQKAFENLD